ncbi:LOB domain-containing protein 29-like [Olea europaea var. sylvestris]|uniref:LOB domain-containing protein n=1 Tax=Olea europaea subsp. europaea TaxID=158383 RepID=A0A8S0P7C5_OLEEU|nr:LOB domain-containing protein 29-like [Olea europaea var. sylvestris]CAA2934051.1 Hypothetical predicted protein [Olea europaea subsp. europaea]
MSGSGSPCGACKFLRRKCAKGCVFAPYFCHEQGVSHFAAIHKVFGASNVSKLLAHLPVTDRCEAAITIAYEAQARLQDPIYGCVSHIFALQQQVVNLQAQLASLKEQASQSLNGSNNGNPNDKFYDESHSFRQDVLSWFQSCQNQDTMPTYCTNIDNSLTDILYPQRGTMNPIVKCESPVFPQENISYGSMDSLEMQSNNRQWAYPNDFDDFQSVAFRYVQHS